MVQIIRAAGRVPVQRNTRYEVIEEFASHDPARQMPLVDRDTHTPLDFMKDLPEFLRESA